MARYSDQELHSSQQSVFYHSKEDPFLRTRPDYFSQLYPHMLIEDVANTIMPIGGHSERDSFPIVVVPSNSKAQELIASALGPHDYGGYRGYGGYRDLAQAVWGFFHRCTITLMACGEAVYEIVFLSRPEDGAVVGFDLVRIEPTTVFYRGGKLVQYVPEDVALQHNLPRYIQLSPQRILTFQPPAYAKGKLANILESLAAVSAATFPDFAVPDVRKGSKQIPYDFTVHNHTRQLVVAEAGKLIGWNARGLLLEETLEYYQF